MLKWLAMNERERQQLEIKLRNRRAEFDASLSQFRSSGLGLEISPEDYLNGKPSRLELEFLATAIPAYTKDIIASAKTISRSRSIFEASSDHIKIFKSHFSAEIDLLSAQISGLRTSPRVMQLNFQAIQNAKQALSQIDQIAEEAEFNFAARKVRSGKAPSNHLVDKWIALWPEDDGDVAWQEIRKLLEFQTLSRELFRERWKHMRDNPKRGRPPSKLRSKI
jgi:hypothetical protein